MSEITPPQMIMRSFLGDHEPYIKRIESGRVYQGRLRLKKALLEELSPSIVQVPGEGKHLLMRSEHFFSLENKIMQLEEKEMKKKLVRLFIAPFLTSQADRQGRIYILPFLLGRIGLPATGPVSFSVGDGFAVLEGRRGE